MLVKWEFIYFPAGKWVTPEGVSVKLDMPFRAVLNGQVVLVTPNTIQATGGHGEPGFSARTPLYFDNDTLKRITIDPNTFIDVNIES